MDIWLPDLKYVSPELSARYSNAPDYFEVASNALAEMVRQTKAAQRNSTWVPDFCAFDADGMMTRGVLVRHLILPGQTEDSRAVLCYLYETYGDDIWVSIMSQFTPVRPVPGLERPLSQEEYDEVVDFAAELGMTNAYVQEGAAASESFIPDFEHFDLRAFLQN